MRESRSFTDQNLKVTQYVHEHDMSYLKMKIWFGFGDRQNYSNPAAAPVLLEFLWIHSFFSLTNS
jgi:hypothetical protein